MKHSKLNIFLINLCLTIKYPVSMLLFCYSNLILLLIKPVKLNITIKIQVVLHLIIRKVYY